MDHRLLGFIFVCAITSCLHGEDVSSKTKSAEPDAPALKDAMTLVSDVYKLEIAAAKTPAQKKMLATKLLDAAKDEKDSGRYALLVEAKNLSADAGDLDGCDRAFDLIESSYDAHLLKMRSDTYSEVARLVHSFGDQVELCKDISDNIRSALNKEQFAIAKSDSDVGLRVANASNDASLIRHAKLEIADVRRPNQVSTIYKVPWHSSWTIPMTPMQISRLAPTLAFWKTTGREDCRCWCWAAITS